MPLPQSTVDSARHEEGEQLEPSWREAVHDYPLPMMIVDLFAHEVTDVNRLAFNMFALREGRPVKLVEHIGLDQRNLRLADLVRWGTVDGFEARVSTRNADGPPLDL